MVNELESGLPADTNFAFILSSGLQRRGNEFSWPIRHNAYTLAYKAQ